MEKWNPNDCQGRRKDQYESSAKFTFWASIAFVVIIVIGLIIK